MLSLRVLTSAALSVLTLACSPGLPPRETFTAPVGEPEEILRQLGAREIPVGKSFPLPRERVTMPRAGQENAFKILVTPALEQAYDAYLEGDGERALRALDTEAASAQSMDARWHESALRAQILIMMGRAADADWELDRTARLERKVFGDDLFAGALRGEAHVWTGEYDRALEVLTPVALALDRWRLPTRYFKPPSNVPELVYRTTAQLRTYTALAGLFLLQEHTAEALVWARRAEILYADVHYVANHGLYGRFVAAHADSFYGRALNLSFLAAARIVESGDADAGTAPFDAAEAFYEALGYAPGKVTTQALRAWAYLRIGQAEAADAAAARAVELALSAGLADLVWRVQALRAEALLASGERERAEAAYRNADAAVDAVSGNLSSDRAKRRFGIGKEDISYRISIFNLERGELGALFHDLERARARAFVDMLAGRSIAEGRASFATQQIGQIDRRIRNHHLRASGMDREAGDRELQAHLAERTARISELARTDPDLAETFRIEGVTLGDVRRVLEPDELLLYGLPARGEDPLRFIAVRPDGERILDTRTSGAAVQATLARLRSGIERADRAVQITEVRTLADQLKVARWPRVRTVYIVPTGVLFFVPWGAIVEQTQISVLPTGAWILKSRPRNVPAHAAVVLGDPDFGGSLPQLPGARAEAEWVAARYHVEPLLAANATESALRRRIGSGTEVLHLATYGAFDAEHPMRAAVMLAGEEGDLDPLTAAELFARPLRAELVVLSACDTGMGQVVAGDDFLGLIRSFYLGGAQAVLTSLWPVSDEGTQRFMRAFHENLHDRGYREAWLAARNEVKRAGEPPAVYGAFVLGGGVGP